MAGWKEDARDYDADDPPRFGEWVRLRKVEDASMSEPSAPASAPPRVALPSVPSAALYHGKYPAPSRSLFQRLAPMTLVVPALMGFVIVIGVITYRGNHSQATRAAAIRPVMDESVPHSGSITKLELESPSAEGGKAATLLVHVDGIADKQVHKIKVQIKRPGSAPAALPSPVIKTRQDGKDGGIISYEFLTHTVTQTELDNLFVQGEDKNKPLEVMLTVHPADMQKTSPLETGDTSSKTEEIAHLKAEIEQKAAERQRFLDQYKAFVDGTVDPAKKALDDATKKVEQQSDLPGTSSRKQWDKARAKQAEAKEKHDIANVKADAIHKKALAAFEARKKAIERLKELEPSYTPPPLDR